MTTTLQESWPKAYAVIAVMTKPEIRGRLLQNRAHDSHKDKLILESLLGLKEFQSADLILTYVSMPLEIDTRELIQRCFDMNKRLAVPKVTEFHSMTFYEIESFSDLERGKFGIDEPNSACKKAQICANSLCILPALACDERGFRLGYGKGYYDRFLENYGGKSAALCYSDNIMKLPIEAYDIAADIVITEGGIFYGR